MVLLGSVGDELVLNAMEGVLAAAGGEKHGNGGTLT
jgi:hypothetical protein